RELHTNLKNQTKRFTALNHSKQQLSRQTGPGVFSLKRDRQSLFQRTGISTRPASLAAHVSLSSIFNCQKTDTHQCQKNLTKTTQGLDPKDKTRKPIFSFLKNEGHRR
ncbi:hypothetical protein, partial [Agrobacterium rubi]|uniref:hypothetical protein n=1 Tax=Agrobacterium rubi TaxID=28099 RepID=UPI00201B70E7